MVYCKIQWFCAILAATFCWVRPEEGRPVLTTPLGTIRGSYYQSVGGRQYAAFEGIPYAKPPVKKHRFREPRPVRQWEGTLQARFLYTCIQYNNETIGDEDCLYLNVYTPDLQPASLLDVIVFIHGGGFFIGSGHSYGEKILMDKNVVFVNFNYRLGPFGFLSTQDNVVPGNNGMKDQVLALKWIKNNIQHFGGNPNSITLTGVSAGAASVHLHYMSPQSLGLFNRGFSQSGTALNPWVLQENPLENTRKLARLLECDSENTRAMINCLNHIPAKIVVEAMKHFQPFLFTPVAPLGVVVEPKSSLNPFLNEHPYETLQKGNIQDMPWITSAVQSDGLYPAAAFLSDSKYLPELENRWTELAKYLLDYNYTASCSDKAVIAQRVKEFYLKSEGISRDTFDQLVQMIGDRLLLADAGMAARIQASKISSPVYYYRFTYRGAHSESEWLSKCNEDFGVCHGDDTIYVLQSNNIDTLSTELDRKMSQTLVAMWTSYARTGIPLVNNVSWTAVSSRSQDPLNYIQIQSPDTCVEKTDANFGNREFWHSLPLKENQNLFTKPQR